MNRTLLFEVTSYDQSNYDEVSRLISEIEEKLEDGDDVSSEIARVHIFANKENKFNEDTFRNYWTAMSKEELIEEILTPSPPKIENISQEEILLTLTKMTKTDLAHSDYYLSLLRLNSSYTHGISDLIFWPNELGYDLQLSIEEQARIIFENEAPPKSLRS